MKRPLSTELTELAAQFGSRPVRLAELVAVLQLRGYNALLLFLALPFVTPVPLPGLSTPFGILIALLGCRMSLGWQPWLPESFAERELPASLLPKFLRTASQLMLRLERLLKPRLFYPDHPHLLQRVSGGIICICGFLLLLPLPVPFSNAFPALTIILLAAAGLERDGIFFLAGTGMFLLCLGFFFALAFGGSEALRWLFQ